ncbi:MobV family relaxase [Lentibacillus jeotgali]|uniref:MobV family relaxase n=1 Tax=Lentibacillus jeotgali TaxID=558169 RepID=UPI000262887B|nr:MobV family relaxase [Lentibacillus jeotgali]
MSYSIMRVEKVKGSVNTMGIQKHVQRENKNYNNKDIDHEKTGLNYDLVHGKERQNYKNLIEKRIEEGYTGQRKIRSDAVRHVDGIITSDKAFFDGLSEEQMHQYFQDSFEFLENEYGKENILYAAVHLDESTPHMHFGTVPLTPDGRMSAKEVVGNKKALTNLQDRYNQFMNERGFDLERGQSKQVTEKKHEVMDRYKQGTNYHENIFRQTKEKTEQEEKKLDALTEALEPQELKYEGREIKTEVNNKVFGKAEVLENETGNVVLTPEQYKKAAEQVNAAAAIQKDYQRLKNADLVQENQRLKQVAQKAINMAEESKEKRADLQKQNASLQKTNMNLLNENDSLKSRISDLKNEIKLMYQNTREFLKENTKDMKSFKNLFKGFMDKFKDKYAKAHEKDTLEPKKSEFEKAHQQKINKQKEHDLSL